MAPRANWKGFLKLSLVSCSIGLVQATSSRERVRFNIINRETGNRVRYRQIDAETGEDVPEEDRIKGFKAADGSYVLLEPEELDEVALESTHTIDIDSFVPRKEIDEIYLDTPYYLFPDDKVGVEAFAVIRDAMRATGLVGLARVVLHNHEFVLMLEPLDKGIKATALRYQDEIRDGKEYFSDIETVKVPKDMLELAEHILKTKRGHFDPSKFSDRYEDALKALIKAKQAGKPAPAVPERPSNVINLMDALRRSVRSERSGGEASAHRGKQRTARSSTASRKRGAVKSKRLKRAS
ncbi:MAG: Ku protein [Xanthobacteraceae bacterium]